MTTASETPKNKKIPAIALTPLTIALLLYVVWRLDTAPRTDNAYVNADTIMVVPEVSGKIVELPVKNNRAVKEGDLLFQIDPRTYEDNLIAARARLVALDKQIELAQRNVNAQEFAASAVEASVEQARVAAKQATDTLERMAPLLEEGYVSADELDRAKTQQEASQAELQSALLRAQQAAAAISSVEALVAQRVVIEAEIASAELQLERTTVRAPFDGRVVSLETSVGEYASPAKSVFTLIDTREWFVIANFRETELKHIRPGTRTLVYVLSNPDVQFEGVVDSIGYGVYPDDGGSTAGGLPDVKRNINWVRVAQRFPVKIVVEDPDPELFRIGASAVVVLRSSDKSGDGK